MKKPVIYNPDDPIEVAVKTNLEEGQIFGNFNELCRLCGISSDAGGKQRNLAKATLSHYVDLIEFIPEGRRRANYRINKIYDVPHLQSGRSGRYRSRLIRLILFHLANSESSTPTNSIIMTFDQLAEKGGLIRPAFEELVFLRNGDSSQASSLPKFVKELNPRHISDFIASCRGRFNEYLRGALHDMVDRGLIMSFDENYWLNMSDGSQRWAEDWEREIISRLFDELVTSVKPLHLMNKAERKSVLKRLMNEINDECIRHYESCDEFEEIPDTLILQYSKKILIIYNMDEMRMAAERSSTPLLDSEQSIIVKEEVSSLFSATMKQVFTNQYNGLIRSERIKNEEISENLAFGDISYQTPYAFIYGDYIEVMDKLIALAIDMK